MPRRGRRRRKHRTHVDEENTQPIALVARRGQVGPYFKQLVKELRIVLYPNSPLHFKENSRGSLKEMLSVAKSNQVDHLIFVTNTTNNSYLKAVKLPSGPTITFKIQGFTLSSDVRSSLKKYVRLQPDFKAPPLLVMKGIDGMPDLLFRSIFPSMSLSDIKLKRCRRVVLIDKIDGEMAFRHYMIKSRPAGISQALKKLSRNQVPNLNKFNSIGEWIDGEGNASESEYEDAQVPEDSRKVSLRLVELGPRLTLKLHKIEESICTGNVMFHAIVKKSKKDSMADGNFIKEKNRVKEERRNTQNENIKKKLLKRRQKLNILTRKKRKLSIHDSK
jgi:ribosome biogenesis protein SSF1/2